MTRERVKGLLGNALLKLVLFGSRARGDEVPDSDVDVAIVVRGLDAETKDRILSTVTGIREELSRAENALAASMLLADGGFPLDAVSRLYFSLLFRVGALLLTAGLEPKSHEGALRLLSLLFV